MTQEVVHNEEQQLSAYPIVSGRALRDAGRRMLGIRSARRDRREMVRPEHGHHVLVYKVDGGYIEDNVSLGSTDERVVRATHVSVVDMRRDAPVVVEFLIPSKDSAEFTVRVTFGCTVTHPITVVQEGLNDPRKLLTNYLMSYHNVMQMALEFELDEVNELRRWIDEELTAYRTVSPPLIPGLHVQMAAIEVLTPAAVEERDNAIRDARHRHLVATGQLGYWTDYQAARTHSEHEVALAAQQREQERDYHSRDYTELVQLRQQEQFDALAWRRQQAELARQVELQNVRLAQARHTAQWIQGDLHQARYLAHGEGGTAAQLAEQLQMDMERQELRAQTNADRDWEASLEDVRFKRELERQRQAAEQAQRIAEWQEEVENARALSAREERLALLEQQKAQLELQWRRDDQVQANNAQLEEIRRARESRFQFIRDLIQRGHLDTADLNSERLMAMLLDDKAMLGGADPHLAIQAEDTEPPAPGKTETETDDDRGN